MRVENRRHDTDRPFDFACSNSRPRVCSKAFRIIVTVFSESCMSNGVKVKVGVPGRSSLGKERPG